ncbi:hypothetical protein [Flavobacterium sasangense]|uniref:hypothetical protein n=1 Tax=Flavobacterium sasangense TaxID=503361 RepID=UPI000479D1E0|nr:hypothetical protein [Flavobacterium sasangense]
MSKKIFLSFIFPLSVIIFILFTKWWIVDVVDGTDGIMYGFPFIYKSPTFASSMAEEYFITELIIDFTVYLGIITAIIYTINRFIYKFKFRKIVFVFLIVSSFLLVSLELFLALWPDNMISLKRDYEIKIKETGLKFYFDSSERNNFDNYHK